MYKTPEMIYLLSIPTDEQEKKQLGAQLVVDYAVATKIINDCYWRMGSHVAGGLSPQESYINEQTSLAARYHKLREAITDKLEELDLNINLALDCQDVITTTLQGRAKELVDECGGLQRFI